MTDELRLALLIWFDHNRRPLPWRRDRDPYRIWVSEVMLQQTTVAVAASYFERFVTTLPTIADLATADESEVLRLWAGLGFYRRAKNLHTAAKRLLISHQGQIPNDPQVFGELPGVGRYMLGAVLSQAFDRRLPILEANTRRLFARWLGETGELSSATVLKRLWQAAEDALPATGRIGDFNQALMELGALICTPREPACEKCPLRAGCVAYREERQAEIPRLKPPPPVTNIHEVALVVRRGEQVLLGRRPDGGRWAGMWEFPHGEIKPSESHELAAARLGYEMCGLKVIVGASITVVRHAVTRYRVTMTAYEAMAESSQLSTKFYTQFRWAARTELEDIALSSPQRQLARALCEPSLFNGVDDSTGQTETPAT